jgi:DmsE family decaheme c-type cytochrome
MKSAYSVFFLSILFATLPAFAQADAASGFVGSDTCKTCHPDIWSKFYKNPHYKSIASGKETPEHTGCESCHGPGRAHVAARGGKASIVAFSQLEPKQILDNCLRCHAETLSRANIRLSSHTEAGIACTSCHSIHKSPAPKFLLADKQAEMCYGCHADVRSQFSMPFKHRVNEGALQCTDCHNPHGASQPTWRNGERPRMMQQALGNEEPCLKCHAEKRGPFVFEHPPVRIEGCEACHYPHGSTNSRLLRRPVVFTMCLECHNGAPGFSRTGSGDPVPVAFHNLSSPRFQNCTNCHVRIHGSNADPYFLK